MKLHQLIRELRSRELPYMNAKSMICELSHEEYLRKSAEDAYVRWLKQNNPDSIKFGYPNNPNDYEKFMFIEGYIASGR